MFWGFLFNVSFSMGILSAHSTFGYFGSRFSVSISSGRNDCWDIYWNIIDWDASRCRSK